MKMTERDRLIGQLGLGKKDEYIADYILADRQAILDKICEPIKEVFELAYKRPTNVSDCMMAIMETRHLAEEMKGK